VIIFFLSFKCLTPYHSVDCLGHPVNCRFTCCIFGVIPQLPQTLLLLQGVIKSGSSLFSFQSVTLHIDSLYAETREAVKL